MGLAPSRESDAPFESDVGLQLEAADHRGRSCSSRTRSVSLRWREGVAGVATYPCLFPAVQGVCVKSLGVEPTVESRHALLAEVQSRSPVSIHHRVPSVRFERERWQPLGFHTSPWDCISTSPYGSTELFFASLRCEHLPVPFRRCRPSGLVRCSVDQIGRAHV